MDKSGWLLLQHVILNNKTFIVVMILYILVSADKRPLGQFVSQASLSVYFPLLGSTWYNFLLLTVLHDFYYLCCTPVPACSSWLKICTFWKYSFLICIVSEGENAEFLINGCTTLGCFSFTVIIAILLTLYICNS